VMAHILPLPWFIRPGRYIQFCESGQVIKPGGRGAEVKDSLNCLPIGLKEMYKHMPLWIRKGTWNISVLILFWVTMAVRPLTLTELGVATRIRLVANLSLDKAVMDHISFCRYFLSLATMLA